MKKKAQSHTTNNTINGIELIKLENPELNRLASLVILKNKENFNHKMFLLTKTPDRVTCLNKEMADIRQRSEDEVNRMLYNLYLNANNQAATDFKDSLKAFILDALTKPKLSGVISHAQIIERDKETLNGMSNFIDLIQKGNIKKSRNINSPFKANKLNASFIIMILTYHYDKEYYEFLKSKEIELSEEAEEEIQGAGLLKEYTTARQVMAIYYLVTQIKKYDKEPVNELSKFIQFLTRRETNAKNIRNTSIRKYVERVFPSNEAQLDKDLKFIRTYFENLGLTEIVARINKEIGVNP